MRYANYVCAYISNHLFIKMLCYVLMIYSFCIGITTLDPKLTLVYPWCWLAETDCWANNQHVFFVWCIWGYLENKIIFLLRWLFYFTVHKRFQDASHINNLISFHVFPTTKCTILKKKSKKHGATRIILTLSYKCYIIQFFYTCSKKARNYASSKWKFTLLSLVSILTCKVLTIIPVFSPDIKRSVDWYICASF